jgi:nitrite reductase/ring-hydroxylating ferredoxin subunit
MNSTLQRLCAFEDLAAGEGLKVLIPGRPAIAVFKLADGVVAVDDACTHKGASLAEDGFVEGHIVQCTWHNGKFDLRNGEAVAPPCIQPLRKYRIEVRDGSVFAFTAELFAPA